MKHPNPEIMHQAIALARSSFKNNGNAVAAIIVKGDKVIASSTTTIKIANDSTCHAEMNAIRLASKKLSSRYLKNCYLYTTFEPCPMCTSAAIWAKLKGIVYGASHKDRTPQEHWRIMIPAANIVKKGYPRLILHKEFMRQDCVALLRLA